MIQFSVDPGLLSFNLTVPLNILIGNVPLRCFFSSFTQQQDGRSAPALLSPLDYYPTPSNSQQLPDGLMGMDQYPDLRNFTETL